MNALILLMGKLISAFRLIFLCILFLLPISVRQESERQQENLNRFKFGRNYSESQFLAAAQEDVP